MTTSSGRNRFPPAAMTCWAASVTMAESARAASISAVSISANWPRTASAKTSSRVCSASICSPTSTGYRMNSPAC